MMSTFIKNFHTISLSGDSGRTSSSIESKERRQLSNEFKNIIYNSRNYLDICRNIEYKYDSNYPYLIK